MKQLLFFALSFVLISNSCKKKKDEEPQLPPETTTGAYTFGCKVNGKVFVPRSGRGKPGLFAQYVNLGTGSGGGWFLQLNASDEKLTTNVPGINVFTDSVLLQEGSSYFLKKDSKGFASANYFKGLDFYPMLSSNTGELTITRHDRGLRILSGRFFFTATNASGQRVEITDGRFDIVY